MKEERHACPTDLTLAGLSAFGSVRISQQFTKRDNE